tara:strand:- start:3800 stop:4765 length:966 start_codon:yes stop_codon:yes gene_type:complete
LIPEELSVRNIEKIYNTLNQHVIETPFIQGWANINDVLNTEAIFKLEFLQNSGTFKVRGAINNVLNLSNKSKSSGITAVSAGNHAIAASYVASKYNLKNKIFIYKSANSFRIKKCKELKANLHFTDPHSAFKDVEKASKEEGYHFIHPFDGSKTLQGTASLGFEIFKQIKNIDYMLISVGGGGLISGIGSLIKQLNPNCKIIGIEPEGAKGMKQSLLNNSPIKNVKLNTIADSLASPLHMEYSFSICKKVIDEIVIVKDEDLKKSMLYMFQNFKLMLEPACVTGIAALMGPLQNKLKGKKTLILLCGSNIDLKTWRDLAFT